MRVNFNLKIRHATVAHLYLFTNLLTPSLNLILIGQYSHLALNRTEEG